jgi:hypothetical protein
MEITPDRAILAVLYDRSFRQIFGMNINAGQNQCRTWRAVLTKRHDMNDCPVE